MPNVYTFKDFEGSSHRILLQLVREFTRVPGGRILDLGAAGGELGEALRDRFDETFGFDFDVDNIDRLHKSFDHAVIADLERLVALPSRMRCIILADVLEHLRDPRRALEMVRRSLDENGRIFVSVPNIANITIRLGLLFGVFRYRDRGILDHSHLRFYTRRTIVEELRGAGLEIDSVHASSVPIRLVFDGRIPGTLIRLGERILVPLTRTWKSLFGYQIILVVRPR